MKKTARLPVQKFHTLEFPCPKCKNLVHLSKIKFAADGRFSFAPICMSCGQSWEEVLAYEELVINAYNQDVIDAKAEGDNDGGLPPEEIN